MNVHFFVHYLHNVIHETLTCWLLNVYLDLKTESILGIFEKQCFTERSLQVKQDINTSFVPFSFEEKVQHWFLVMYVQFIHLVFNIYHKTNLGKFLHNRSCI